jgi:hypothetical protein
MLRRHYWHLRRCLHWLAVQMLVNGLLPLVNARGLSWCCTIKVWHFCLDFLVAVLGWHRDRCILRLFCAVVVIIKVIIMIVRVSLMRWSHRGRIGSGKILRGRLGTKSWLLRGGVRKSGWCLVCSRRL